MVHLSHLGYHSAESSPMVKEDDDFDLDFELVIAPEDKVCFQQQLQHILPLLMPWSCRK
jgi:hypothetical protein